MKIKHTLSVFCIALFALSLAGCRLAQPHLAEGKQQDRLVGVFITDEYLDLFDLEGYLTKNQDGFSGGEQQLSGNAEAYQGRLYASVAPQSQNKAYTFGTVDGIYCFELKTLDEGGESYTRTHVSDEISDLSFHVSVDDNGETTTMDATVYLPPGNTAYYLNPVFEDADGAIYATSGSGISMSSLETENQTYTPASEGQTCFQTLEQRVATSDAGSSSAQTTTIRVTFETILPPQSVTLLAMDASNTVLSRQTYAPGTLPESITPTADTAYFIVESKTAAVGGAGNTTRALFSDQDSYLESFCPTDRGIITKYSTQLNWPGAPDFPENSEKT